jgi:peptide/nickel transport system substrate-binding protein
MRKLTLLNLLAVLVLLLAACGPAATEAPPVEEEEVPVVEEEEEAVAIEAEEEEPTAVPPVEVAAYGEAPMLAEMVEAGELPAVDERLPVEGDILVVPVVDSIGEYGGTWHALDEETGVGRMKMALYEPFVRWKADYTGYEPGLAKEWEFEDDGNTLILHFRQGVKWSDGVEFTMEDLRFWWEDMALNEDYAVVAVPWYGFNTDNTPMTVEFPDDYTMVMKWDSPHWVTPFTFAQGFWESMDHLKPAHYLKDFHPTYNADASYDDLELADKYWETPGYPCLFAWCCSDVTPGERVFFERNPYYWKVDPEGNQLPYIDFVEVDIVIERETRILQLSQGKYDIDFRGSNNPLDIPFLTEQAEAGDYHLQPGWMNGAGAWPGWLINQDYVPDEGVRDLLRDTNFRKGISVAMDRDRIIDVAWGGIGTPQQSTISPQSWHFASPEGLAVFEEWQQADAEYNPDLAVDYFEQANFTDQDGDGWRDLPSGAPFELVIDMTGWARDEIETPAAETFRENLEAVGVKTAPLNMVSGTPESGLRERESTFMLRGCHASEVDIWTYPDWIFPLRGGGEGSRSWPMQGKWRQTGGAEGWEPEPDSPAARLQALYDQGMAEPTVEGRHEIVWQAIRVHIEDGPFTLGAAGDQPMPVVVKNNVHNVPEFGILGPWAPGSPGNTNPSQYWIEQ